jgi:hypothetical protein
MRNAAGRVLTAAGSIAFLVAAIGAASAQNTPAPYANRCFYTSDFDTWRAPDDKTIFIRVHPDRYFRLDLSKSCPVLMWPGAHLITEWRSTNWICNAIDWNLRVSQVPNGGITMACIVQAMTPMTPDEVKAIPPKFKP